MMYEWVISETRDGLWSTTLFLGEIAVWKSTVNFQFRQQALEQVRDTIAAFLTEGTNITLAHDDENDTLTISATDTDTDTTITDEAFQDKFNALVSAGSNITITYDDENDTITISGTPTQFETDETMQGDGSPESPFGVVPESGEIGKILTIGNYTYGTSAAPASGTAGYTGGNLYLHTTANDGDKSAALAMLASGDYIHIGAVAILKISSAPTEASNIYTIPVTLVDGEVPLESNHTTYYIKENRAVIAGAIHHFNLAASIIAIENLKSEVLEYWLRSIAVDETMQGDGSPESPLGVAAPADNNPPDVDISMYQTFGSWAWTSTSAPATGQFYVESTELKIFETDSDSTDKRTALDDVAVGDRFQFGELNAFEVTAVGVRSGNGIWTFTGNWAEVFDVGDFDGSYSVRHIKKANVLARNNVVPGRFLRLNDALLPVANDPEDSIEPLWEGSLGSASVETANNLNAGKKFSDYTHIIFNYSGSNKRNLWIVPRKLWDQLGFIEVSNKDNHLTVRYINDTSFEVGVATGTILLRKIQGYRGV